MRKTDYTLAIKNLLAEASALMGYELELVPDTYPKEGANNLFGYRVQRENDPDNRIMSLAVDLAMDNQQAFVQLPDGRPTLNSNAKDRIFAAFARFWSPGNSEKHTYIEV